MPHDPSGGKKPTANFGYGINEILAAYSTAESHEDRATRERAREKIGKWVHVLAGMLSGKLSIGSRQPVSSVPVWATPEVVTGGFATGRLLAGGRALLHEVELTLRLGGKYEHIDREALNSHYLSEGFSELVGYLHSGCYTVEVPEEGALLVVAWLVTNGHTDEARQVLDAIAPYFSTLRFYPRPARPFRFGAGIFLKSAGEVLDDLREIVPNPRILAEREAIHVWRPLYRRMIRQFSETVSGEMPNILPLADGSWISPGTKRFNVVGGWPCQNYPPEWQTRADVVLADVEAALAEHKHCTGQTKAGGSFATLHGYLKRCVKDSSQLTGRDVGRIRLILSRHLAKYGVEDSEEFRRIQAKQLAQSRNPTHFQLAAVVQHRLAAYPSDLGIEDIDHVIEPITERESASFGLIVGTPVPASVARKTLRCLCDSADVLVSRGIVRSGESLAQVIPQITSGVCSDDFEDPQLRDLFGEIYRSFRRRRSLLLLNLEKQVGLGELPWVAAVERFRRGSVSGAETARQTLKELVVLTLRSFPHAIIPNKLLQEFQALAKAAGLDLPLLVELAADIFMGDFSQKYTDAAKLAAELMKESLYARYYEVDHKSIRLLPEINQESGGRPWSRSTTPVNPLVSMCVERAGLSMDQIGGVVHNGMVIEQSQILTTHNLAVLFDAFNLGNELRPDLRSMAEQCLRWILTRQRIDFPSPHGKLIMRKNTAYAWRQLVFYVSFLPLGDAYDFIGGMNQRLHHELPKRPDAFRPVLDGLLMVFTGHSLDRCENSRRFLGWVKTERS
jgi:hypothetical protein